MRAHSKIMKLKAVLPGTAETAAQRFSEEKVLRFVNYRIANNLNNSNNLL